MRRRAVVGLGFLIGAAAGILLVATVLSRFVTFYVD
jgi:hypothetical protein